MHILLDAERTVSTETQSNPDAHDVEEQTVRQHQSIAN